MGFNAPDCHAPLYESLKSQEDVDQQSDSESKGSFKKMPISYLQEWCGRKKVTPIYHIRASEGQVHEPTFVYSVMVEDITGMGRGRNKKMAKHYAALDALHKIIQCGRYNEWFNCETPEDAYELLKENVADLDSMPGGNKEFAYGASETLAENLDDLALEGTGAANPIGKLGDLCRQRHWPQPDYQPLSDTGMPHDKTFVIKVNLGLFSKEGTARTKRLAKKFAAEAMLKFLNEIPLEERDRDLALEDDVNAEDEDEMQNVAVPSGDLDADLAKLGQQSCLQSVEPDQSLEIVDGQFKFNFNGFGNGTVIKEDDAELEKTTNNEETAASQPVPECLKRLAEFDVDNRDTSIDVKTLLEDVCKEKGQPFSFVHLERKSKDGKFLCMLDFGNIHETFVGKGETRLVAEIEACRDALDILKQKL